MADRFFIGPISEGLRRDLKPWAIPEDAFERLRNAYVFRGRIRKRFGSVLVPIAQDPSVAQLYSRAGINIGLTAAVTGNFGPFVCPGTVFKVGQMFAIGDTMFTVTNGAPGPQAMLTTGAATGTYDTATGTVTITGNAENPGVAVYFYPAEPIMGIHLYETTAVNDEPTLVFDTQFAYEYLGGRFERAGVATWTTNASKNDYFWATTWQGLTDDINILFVTNFVNADVIKYWNGAAWTNFSPLYDAANAIVTARIIIPFQGRLLFLNTRENPGPTQFRNRCRYSQFGSPLDVNSWREDLVGRGSFIDAPTQEAIVSAQFIKNRLIVFYERSTWEIVYTGNEILPFRWQQINTELGVESTFSIVPFDKVALGIGDVGIHACNGMNVERIDDKIPDEVFSIHNGNSGPLRVVGVRDYYAENVYWTFPSQQDEPVFPNQILVYNYKNNTWAINDDSYTFLGYFQNPDDRTWASTPATWAAMLEAWNSGSFQSEFTTILAGNQQGYIHVLDPRASARNASGLQITTVTVAGLNITMTVIDHNLTTADYVLVEQARGITALNDRIYRVQATTATTITIIEQEVAIPGVYTGGGTLARVSQIDILTKEFNFYLRDGRATSINKIDFYVTTTASGEITVDYAPSSSRLYMLDEAAATGTNLSTGILETFPYATVPLEATQDRLWHHYYLTADGDGVQLRLFLNDDDNLPAASTQMRNPEIALQDFQLHAFIINAFPSSVDLG